MAMELPKAGLRLEENTADATDHLPTQAFILDLSDDIIEGMLAADSKGLDIQLSLGNRPTFIYGQFNYRIEQSVEDAVDDLELFLAGAAAKTQKAERLPQHAMSLFRKPELNSDVWANCRTSSSEDEDEEYEEATYSPDADDGDQRPNDNLNSDIALLRNSMAQKAAEKQEKSTRVIEGTVTKPNGRGGLKHAANSMQKALSGKKSPFNRGSLSPLPTVSPALSASGSPSLRPSDLSQQTVDRLKQARAPIIHELALKEQPYSSLWKKYPSDSEADFKNALDKVADHDEDTHNYVLRKKYWKELDVWNHKYTSDSDRQQAIENAVRQFDRMRLSTTEPEWDRLLPKEERGQGRILSKVQANIAKGPAAPRIRVQRPDDASQDASVSGGSSQRDALADSGGSGGTNGRADDTRTDLDSGPRSPSRPGAGSTTARKKLTAREAQEKRLTSTRKKKPAAASAPSSTKVSPVKAGAKASTKQQKFKSDEYITKSDSSDSEPESMLSVGKNNQHPTLNAATAKSSIGAKPALVSRTQSPASVAAAVLSSTQSAHMSSSLAVNRSRKEASATTSAPANSTSTGPGSGPVRKAKPSYIKDPIKPPASVHSAQPAAKTLPTKKRARDDDDDDSSSGSTSSSGMPLIKRIKPLKPASKVSPTKERERPVQQRPHQTSSLHGASQAVPRAKEVSPTSSNSGSSGSSSGNNSGEYTTSKDTSGTRPKNNNTSPVKSSPLASSPPTNASELDLSSEESVPPISGGNINTAKKRKMVEDYRRNNMSMGVSAASSVGSGGNKLSKKPKHLPDDLLNKAQRFKVYYEEYEAMYRDISSRQNPPKDRVARLLELHSDLQRMKKDIHREAMLRV